MTSDCLMPRATDPPVAADDIVAQAAMYRLIVENTVDIILRYNAARSRIYVSPASREMLGYEPAEMMTSNATMIIHPDDLPLVHPSFLSFGPNRPNLKLEFRIQRKDEQFIWVEVQHCYVQEDGGSIAVMRDITARKTAEILLEETNEKLHAANEILRTLAQQDGLTGLANRRRFDEVLEQEFRRASRHKVPLAVLLIDVDSFKAYNDRYGHIAGDECLRRISRTLQAMLRRPGDHVARYGGEEFVVLLPTTDLKGAMAVAESLREAVFALAIEHLSSVHHVATVSIGACAEIPRNEGNPAHLVEAADRALYQAKSDGRNRVRGSEAEMFAAVG